MMALGWQMGVSSGLLVLEWVEYKKELFSLLLVDYALGSCLLKMSVKVVQQQDMVHSLGFLVSLPCCLAYAVLEVECNS